MKKIFERHIWIKGPRLTDCDYFNDAKCRNMIQWPPKFEPITLVYSAI